MASHAVQRLTATAALLNLVLGCGGDTTHDSSSRGDDTGGTGGVPAPTGGAAGAVAISAGAGGAAGSGGAAGEAALPRLCDTTLARPPGCPCASTGECDGLCLAEANTLPCEDATEGVCTNPPHGGCVCSLEEGGPTLMCIEREVCPDARPTTGDACTLLAMPCDYDVGTHERCWCLDRFGSAAWECMSEDAACPYSQPTPDSACEGGQSCLYVTVSSLAYRCQCLAGSWSCEASAG
jgi:hypothetical protein